MASLIRNDDRPAPDRYDESRHDEPPSTVRGAPLGDAPPPARERAQYDAPPPPHEDRYGPGYSGYTYGAP